MVDTMGLLLAVVVTAANVDDAKGAQEVLRQLAAQDFPRLNLLWADNKYHKAHDGFRGGGLLESVASRCKANC
jgi:putative transposase